jgi:hypothetical protein
VPTPGAEAGTLIVVVATSFQYDAAFGLVTVIVTGTSTGGSSASSLHAPINTLQAAAVRVKDMRVDCDDMAFAAPWWRQKANHSPLPCAESARGDHCMLGKATNTALQALNALAGGCNRTAQASGLASALTPSGISRSPS